MADDLKRQRTELERTQRLEAWAELQQLVKTGLAAHAYPRNVIFIDEMPKTPSGKVQRFVLRDQRRRELAS